MAALAGVRGWGQQATLVGDAHVSSARPSVNSGSLSNLNVGGGYTALVQFDLGTLPAGTTAAQVTRATLRMYCNRADTPGAVSVEAVGGAWGEAAVTYTTLPGLGPAIQTAQVGTVGQYVTFDVTAAVQGWVTAPASNNGLALTASAAVVQFDSKENDQTAHAPELQIALVAGGAGTGAAGATGAVGATGLTGATGLQGVAGTNGLAGAAGTTGAAGLKGATGLAGATGSGVAGATGATGAVGAAGLNGVAGVTGVQGVTGVGLQGATGAAGSAGIGGATGSPGLVYQGTYSSTTNYALGDVVVFAGSSYASLTGANHGNTPGLVAAAWGLLTAQGPVGLTGAGGATGATGVQGLPGSMGPGGPQGAQGMQGIAGQAGAQGIPGVVGATGLQGPMGAQGIAGPTGLSFQGVYSAGTNYALGDGVLWQGAGWVSLTGGNHGSTPDQSPASWAMFAAAGSAGTTGAIGATGAVGAAGSDGAAGMAGATGGTGAVGSTGAAGLVYQGTYSSAANYALGDVVLYAGSSYSSLSAANHGNTPSLSPGAWGLLASAGAVGPVGAMGGVGATGIQGVQGVQGVVGAAGVQGVQGPQGPVGTQGLTGANGVQGAMGQAGPQGIAGQAGAQGLVGGPGATGAQGMARPQGSVGATGLTFVGAYDSSVNYGLGAGVLWQGAGWVSLVAGNHGNAPDQSPSAWAMFAARGGTGATGTVGATGVAGPAGSNGLAGAAGVTGATGVAGATGTSGLVYQGAYSSGANYGLGDVVGYGGSSYASLVGSNHGNTPGVSPGAWGVVASVGAAGPVGATGGVGGTGMQGVQGIQGLVGGTGAQGAQGTQGQAGAQGLTGVNGAQGMAGMTGSQGVAGPAGAQGLFGGPGATGAQGATGVQGLMGATGLSFQGAYSAPANYAVGAGVLWQGAGWVSLVAGNHGNAPDQSPSAWAMFAARGGTGATGTAGATGGAGMSGSTGAQGVTGMDGVTGATGSQGGVGLNFMGAYSAGVSYGVGDAASYGGASYVSLVAGNHGQTPDQSAADWVVLAAQGNAGAAGGVGATGVAGVTGAQGATGVTGMPGAPVSFAGGWSTTQAYAVGAAVSYGGGSYIATVANSGRQPDVSPGYWGLLVASGAVGATGPIGATGFQGPTGYPGATGAQGVVGPTGVAGPQGVVGATGVAGPAGAVGVMGSTGATGLAFQGVYASGVSYGVGDVVSFGGSSYVSLVGSNGGQTPGASPGSWAVLAAAGAAGSAGVAGVTGEAGATGVAGASGVAGATGTAGSNGATGAMGLAWQGIWASGSNYGVGDAVSYGGGSYVSLVGSNHGQAPSGSPGSWTVLAVAGSAGASGTAGATGAQGAAGVAGLAGAMGVAGATGTTGAVGMNFRGAWVAGTNYAVNDAVTYSGSTYLALTAGKNAEPDTSGQAWMVISVAGGVGPTGAAGSAATLSVGTVTTLAAGASATVSNSGTGQTAVLNFGIPQGVAGAAGSSGSAGSTVTGNAFGAIYHPVSFSTTYYSVNSAAASTSEGTVLTWVPLGCTVTRMDVYSQQSGNVKVTLRWGTPSSMADSTTFVCTPSTVGNCPALGSLVIPAGDFLDFRFDNASGTVAGVWTALVCQ